MQKYELILAFYIYIHNIYMLDMPRVIYIYANPLDWFYIPTCSIWASPRDPDYSSKLVFFWVDPNLKLLIGLNRQLLKFLFASGPSPTFIFYRSDPRLDAVFGNNPAVITAIIFVCLSVYKYIFHCAS